MADDKYPSGRYLPVRSDTLIVGGPHGTGDIVIASPWQGERAEACLLYVTSWGNTTTNLLFAIADDANPLMGAAAGTINQSAARGAVFAINGVGVVVLQDVQIGVTNFLRITPQAASSGQIYVGFYWRKVVDFAAQRPLLAPEPTQAEEMTEENEVWRKVKGLPPRAYLQQNPGQLSKDQEQALRDYEALTDMRNHLARTMPPGGRSAK